MPCLPGIQRIIYLSCPRSKNYLDHLRTLPVSPPPKKKIVLFLVAAPTRSGEGVVLVLVLRGVLMGVAVGALACFPGLQHLLVGILLCSRSMKIVKDIGGVSPI